jgi:hypothetical protein
VGSLVAGSLTTAAYAADTAAPSTAPTANCVNQLDKLRPRATAGRTQAVCVRRESVTLTGAQRTKLAAIIAKDKASGARKPASAGTAAGQNLKPGGQTTAADGHRVTGPSRAAGSTGGVSTSSIDDQCANFTGEQWFKERFRACRSQRLWVDFRDVRTRVLVGRLSFLEVDYVVLWDSGFWSFNVGLLRDTAEGDYHGTTVGGSFDCAGPCVIDNAQFPTMAIEQPGDLRGFSDYETTLGPDQVAFVAGMATIWFNKPNTIDESGPLTSQTDDFRCDTKFSNAGCAYPQIPPVFSLDGHLWPTVAEHVAAAQQSGAVGHDWPLTRTTDQNLIANNRDTACPEWIPRPAGKSCDEYPFASTREGASSGGAGRTFQWCGVDQWWWPDGVTDYGATRDYPDGVSGVGWSFCMVDAGENSGAGNDLQTFYQGNRVLDGEEFFVEID